VSGSSRDCPYSDCFGTAPVAAPPVLVLPLALALAFPPTASGVVVPSWTTVGSFVVSEGLDGGLLLFFEGIDGLKAEANIDEVRAKTAANSSR